MNSREFAKLLGVSQSTISRALNGSSEVSKETAQFIRDKAIEYQFVLNCQARSLKIKRTDTIGILFPRFWESLSKNLMFTYIYDCILKEISKIDMDAMIIYDYPQENQINSLERVVRSKKVDGFINLRPTLTKDEVEMITQDGIPCISIFQPTNANYGISQFCSDEYCAGSLTGEYFGAQEGYKLVYLSVPLSVNTSMHRYNGFCAGLSRYQRRPDKVIECALSTKDAYQAVLNQADWFRENRASVFVYNDMLALGVVQALLKLSIPIPSHVQIIGIDDLPMGTWFSPELSTLHTPVHDLVHDGCMALKDMLDGKEVEVRTALYPPQLIHRQTTLG